GAVTTLRTGADFFSSPRLSPGGRRLAWLEWNHPDMPWDATRLFIADVDDNGALQGVRCIAGDEHESVLQPLWRNEQEILFAGDRSNWWNVYAWRDGRTRALLSMDAEFAQP